MLYLAEEAFSVLKDFDSIEGLKAVLLDNTNTVWKAGLVTALEKLH